MSALNQVELNEKNFEDTSAKSSFIIPLPVNPIGCNNKFPFKLDFLEYILNIS